MWPTCVTQILQAYEPILQLDKDSCSQIGRTIPIPSFEESILLDLVKCSIKTLQKQSPLLEITAPVYVVGDIHGNIFDLIRILIYARPPPYSRYMFLGDYVDRGQFSIEVVTLLFALQTAYPSHIYLIRGNHEFESVNSFYGFQNEVNSQYKSQVLYEELNSIFHWLPLAALINRQIFCCHGGLSPKLTSIDQFNQIKRPLKGYDYDFVADLVWSDPSNDNPNYVQSQRGTGVTFGAQAIEEFMNTFSIKHIIRAHQCVQTGISRFNGNDVYTVFSCSNYAEASGNRCGLIFINSYTEILVFSLPPIDQLERNKTKIIKYTKDSFKKEEKTKPLFSMHSKLTDLGVYKRQSSQLNQIIARPNLKPVNQYFLSPLACNSSCALPHIVVAQESAIFELQD